MKHVFTIAGFAQWRAIARELLSMGVPPDAVSFCGGAQEVLFAPGPLATSAFTVSFKIPKAFLEVASFVAMHREPERWQLLYRVLYRIARLGEHHLLNVEVDPDVRELALMQKALARDIHKMHAFVRFRKVVEPSGAEQFIAWYRPDHFIVEHVAPWFARRFGAMRWAILTPDQSVKWDLERLHFGPGVAASAAPQEDALEELWLSYYASVFNPARVNVQAMKKELPVRHWATLPEAQIIPSLLAQAAEREEKMRNVAKASAEEFLPEDRGLPVLAGAIQSCKGCELYAAATQAVFGEGPAQTKIMFVGEQPGEQEDLQGLPFVGPAGQVLNKAMQQAGIDRRSVYVTNAVKHFKFEERGKRRIHKKPKGSEVAACRPWLGAEIAALNPAVIVALGATAALSVGGREFAIQKERGKFVSLAEGRQLLVTVHPSFLLRLPDESREAEFDRFVEDLQVVSKRLQAEQARGRSAGPSS